MNVQEKVIQYVEEGDVKKKKKAIRYNPDVFLILKS